MRNNGIANMQCSENRMGWGLSINLLNCSKKSKKSFKEGGLEHIAVCLIPTKTKYTKNSERCGGQVNDSAIQCFSRLLSKLLGGFSADRTLCLALQTGRK